MWKRRRDISHWVTLILVQTCFFQIPIHSCCGVMKKGSYFERTRSGMTSSPIFSFSLCFFFLFLFALTVESSPFSFPSSTPLSVSLWAGGSKIKKGKNTVNTKVVSSLFHWNKEEFSFLLFVDYGESDTASTYSSLFHLLPFPHPH